MIESFIVSNKTECRWLLDFLNENNNYDFYYTENNNRIFITDYNSLRRMFRNAYCIYTKKEKGDYQGIILVWKSIGSDIRRYYVKVAAKNSRVAKDLLSVLLWNCNKELFIKISKNNKFISVFKEKGFRFTGERGIQILLNREPIVYQKIFKQEDE